jgi:beta-glucanase (GH16 family)
MTRLLVMLAALGGGAACSEPPVATDEQWQEPLGGWVEVWRDDFEGAADAAPDPARWNLETNEIGHNNELNHNTDDRKNSFLDGNGNLVLQALDEPYVAPDGVQSSQPYSSARLNTRGKLEQTYGKFEARLKLPAGGRGIWPAFWMLGADIDEVGWPECGEVDILEWRGSDPATIIGSLHGPNYSGGNSYNDSYELPAGSYGEFHLFTFEWTAQGVRWLIDGNEYYVKNADSIRAHGQTWAYDHPFFLILNLAIGGIFDGDPDGTTVFPQQLVVDYVSVSQLAQP